MGPDKVAAYDTLRGALVAIAKLAAPFVPFIAEAVYQNLRSDADPTSVHLATYPEADDTERDAGLEAEMALARSIAALGHQARHAAQIKVRQPLARAIVVRPTLALSEDVRLLIEQELNVKRLDAAGDATSLSSLSAQPNFKTLGPRLGGVGQKAAAWIKAQSAETLRDALSRGPLQVELDGQTVQILADDVVFASSLADGYVEAAGGSERVLLDVRLDDELRRQGTFREVAHRIQLARKEAGLDVTDRIVLSYEADPELDAVLTEHKDELAAEVLAVEIRRQAPGTSAYRETIELPEGRLEIGLARAAAD